MYKKPDFPPKFKFDKADTELLLPIVLTTDKGYYIGEPSIDKDGDDSDDDNDDDNKKGIHGYHPLHVKEMNVAMFGVGPDLEKNHVVNTIDQVDLYNVFCKLLKIKPDPNDGNKDVIDDFIHDSSSEEHNEEDNQENRYDFATATKRTYLFKANKKVNYDCISFLYSKLVMKTAVMWRMGTHRIKSKNQIYQSTEVDGLCAATRTVFH